MSELLGLTVAEAAGRIRDGALSAAEYGQAWQEAAAGDRLNAYLWTAEGEADGNGAEGALAGVPVAVKDIFCTEGVPTTAGLADPRGLPAALHLHRGAQADAAPGRGCSARRTWTSSRWAPRTRTRPTGRC